MSPNISSLSHLLATKKRTQYCVITLRYESQIVQSNIFTYVPTSGNDDVHRKKKGSSKWVTPVVVVVVLLIVFVLGLVWVKRSRIQRAYADYQFRQNYVRYDDELEDL